MPYICSDSDGALLNFRLFLKLGALEVGGPGKLPSFAPLLGGPEHSNLIDLSIHYM